MLGIVIIIFAVKIFFEKQQIKKIKEIWATIAGFVSGIFDAMFATGGLPIVTYLAYKHNSKEIIRATIGGILFINAIWRIILLTCSKIITTDILKFSLYMAPFLLIGTVVGTKIHAKINNVLFKKVVVFILIIVGILLVMK